MELVIKVHKEGSQQMMKMAKRRESRAFRAFSPLPDRGLNSSGKNTPYINGMSEIIEIAHVISKVKLPRPVALMP